MSRCYTVRLSALILLSVLAGRSGLAAYEETSRFNSFELVGASQTSSVQNATLEVDLPFPFPFFGGTYSTCYIDVNGKIDFEHSVSDPNPDLSFMETNVMIAAFWEDLRTDGTGFDVYVHTNSTEFTVVWQARYMGKPGAAEFSASLFNDGTIILKYGTDN